MRAVCLVLLFLTIPLAPLRAQVGSTTDILIGVVSNPAGEPLAGATVEAKSVETRVTRRTRTNSDGRYTASRQSPAAYLPA
jgi:hypothetical protein